MLIIGVGVTEVLLSTLVFTCETCGSNAAHQLTKQNRKFSLFFIPLFSVSTKYLDRCTACGRIIEVSKEQAESAARQVVDGIAGARLVTWPNTAHVPSMERSDDFLALLRDWLT